MGRRQGLTDAAIRNAKPGERIFNLYDTGGLYLTISPRGGKWWRLKYQHANKERRTGLGVYPEVSLVEARSRRDKARELLRNGKDPIGEARAQAAAKAEAVAAAQAEARAVANSFRVVAEQWLMTQKNDLAPVTYAKAEWLLGLAYPSIGERPIAEIDTPEILDLLTTIADRGHRETARRVKQRIAQVFRYAIAPARLVKHNPCADLGRMPRITTTPRAALTSPDEVAGLLRAIDAYGGQPATVAALKLAPFVFVRPGELRRAEWAEMDLDAAEWRIPAHKMKMRELHIVPLSAQAVTILRDLFALTGREAYVFPAMGRNGRPMCENTLNIALRAMGYGKEQMCAHGFRAMASTLLNEKLGWEPDVIERQLAHAEPNKVRAVYNRAQYLPKRVKMMQEWADYLDTLRDTSGKIVHFNRKIGA
ncbi:MAG: integrase arm-type DNA-binding domain-containing protein [Rhodanobacteraceae bacterium]